MDKRIFDTVAKIVKEAMEKESPKMSKERAVILDKSSSFMESLEVDSLLALEIVSRIEKKFGIQLNEDDFTNFDTMENISDFIERKIKEKNKNKSSKNKPPTIKKPNMIPRKKASGSV